jgi:hypothetical protein
VCNAGPVSFTFAAQSFTSFYNFFYLLFAVYIFFTQTPLPLFSAGWPAITCKAWIWEFTRLEIQSPGTGFVHIYRNDVPNGNYHGFGTAVKALRKTGFLTTWR